MSMGWKDTQNAQFGRPRKRLPAPTPPSLLERSVAQVLKLHPNVAQPIPPPFVIQTNEWKEDATDPKAGGLEDRRLENKRQQVDNVLSALDFLMEHYDNNDKGRGPLRLVEFCASSGYCGLPFSQKYLARAQVTLLDAKRSSVEIAWKRATATDFNDNLRVRIGRTEDFQETFDLGVGLHACGEATDAILDKCLSARAAFCLVPCCVGRLHRLALGYANKEPGIVWQCGHGFEWSNNVNIDQAKAVESQWKQDLSKMRNSNYDGRPRPRSQVLQRALGGEAARKFAVLAKGADATQWTHEEEEEKMVTGEEPPTSDSLRRKAAKRIVDWDRLQLAEEKGYVTFSFTMVPSTCTPKNEVLFGYPKEWDDSLI